MDAGRGRAAPFHVWTPTIVTSIALHLPAQEVGNLRFVDQAASVTLQERIHVFVDRPLSRPSFLTGADSFVAQWSAPSACKPLTLAQKRQLLALGAIGTVATLDVACRATGLQPSAEDLEAAAGAGAIDCCRKIYGALQRALTHDRTEALKAALYAAARGGQREACEWCLARIAASLRGPEACVAAAGAARGGHERLASWLLERAEGNGPSRFSYTQGLDFWLAGCSLELCRPGVDGAAARRGHLICLSALEGCSLDGVERLLQQAQGGPPGPKAFAMGDAVDRAVSSPTPDWEAKVRWALAQGGRLRATSYTAVVANVHDPKELLKRLSYLEDHGCRPDSYALDTAVAAGKLAAVEWLIGCHGSGAARVRPSALCCRESMHAAAKAGHLDVLKALHSAGCVLPPHELAQAAASGGRLEVLQWAWAALGEEEKAKTAPVFAAAAGADRNNVEAMRWLVAQGCCLSEKAWAAAEDSGCEPALELLEELRCPKPQQR
ncbi:hypothetical protein HYH03_014113 [Edaphochlamys debaryana]|uniref:Ankyrin repeat domain-containing protein n=1 Tax=Edaphochlamys debaryana TaxID=47281 RepID=A0A836BSM3_9CHLO|nr:hypothetical protein HYH03_014113 [Edaphochlamys debaryana]|eukprot:KAG2487272.1 hypothetical protein HYH03_014113 [Edaphochlamys debaryana]